MKKFIVQISHIEYGTIEVEAEDEYEAEELAFKNIDRANWGNDETEMVDVEEIK